jgi:hypothetical protein
MRDELEAEREIKRQRVALWRKRQHEQSQVYVGRWVHTNDVEQLDEVIRTMRMLRSPS